MPPTPAGLTVQGRQEKAKKEPRKNRVLCLAFLPSPGDRAGGAGRGAGGEGLKAGRHYQECLYDHPTIFRWRAYTFLYAIICLTIEL